MNPLGSLDVFDEGAVRTQIAVACEAMGSQKAFAKRAGVSEAYLSDVLSGRRDVTDTLARCIGMRRAVIFYRKGAPEWPALSLAEPPALSQQPQTGGEGE